MQQLVTYWERGIRKKHGWGETPRKLAHENAEELFTTHGTPALTIPTLLYYSYVSLAHCVERVCVVGVVEPPVHPS